ncbi:MAG TPA: co-chaperone GroES [Verrucomicrobiae bacterium]|nr:co-chaperone GroES [Verrucomicrobiae bacterium]
MLKPIGDRVLVKPAPKEEKTATGIFIPDTAKEKPQHGEIIAVGDGNNLDKGTKVDFAELGLKKGTHILFKKHGFSSEEVKIEGEELMILSADDILAILE